MNIILFGFLFLFAANSNAQRPQCQEGQKTFDGCNDCVCSNGIWGCTMKLCVEKSPLIQQECKQGETKALDSCNDCSCANGRWACTRMACPLNTKIATKKSPPKTVECQEGQTKLDSCNDCICSNGNWACTLQLCLDTPPVTEVCKKGETKALDSCNDCICSNGNWACTFQLCLDTAPTTKSPPTTVECQEGQKSFDGCNDCICSNGIWACTMKLCPEAPPATQDVCKAGETKELDSCNSCICTNGIWSCTRMACSLDGNDVAVTTPRNPKKCRPGSGKIENCNRCFCTGTGIWICFKMISCNNN